MSLVKLSGFMDWPIIQGIKETAGRLFRRTSNAITGSEKQLASQIKKEWAPVFRQRRERATQLVTKNLTGDTWGGAIGGSLIGAGAGYATDDNKTRGVLLGATAGATGGALGMRALSKAVRKSRYLKAINKNQRDLSRLLQKMQGKGYSRDEFLNKALEFDLRRQRKAERIFDKGLLF